VSTPSLETALPVVPTEHWLSAKQLAATWGLSDDSVYRWISQGIVAARFFKATRRGRRFHPAVIVDLERQFDEHAAQFHRRRSRVNLEKRLFCGKFF